MRIRKSTQDEQGRLFDLVVRILAQLDQTRQHTARDQLIIVLQVGCPEELHEARLAVRDFQYDTDGESQYQCAAARRTLGDASLSWSDKMVVILPPLTNGNQSQYRIHFKGNQSDIVVSDRKPLCSPLSTWQWRGWPHLAL